MRPYGESAEPKPSLKSVATGQRGPRAKAELAAVRRRAKKRARQRATEEAQRALTVALAKEDR